jgi:D123
MQCNLPSEIYLLLKSSDFISHDLEHAFDDTEEEDTSLLQNGETDGEEKTEVNTSNIQYDLVLRKWVEINPSVEFRCFVRDRQLLAVTQRDLNHFEFLAPMIDELRNSIQDFFDEKLKNTFPDPNFVFDVYIPPPHKRVWLMDINPFAPRTDPLLFSWLEILRMEVPKAEQTPQVVRLQILGSNSEEEAQDSEGDSSSDDEEEIDLPFLPELRLVRRDDPEAYSFNSPQYSAHKLPRDVVDAASGEPGALREFADMMKEMMEAQKAQEAEAKAEQGDT